MNRGVITYISLNSRLLPLARPGRQGILPVMKLITFEAAAAMLGVSVKTIDRMCDRGELRRVALPGKAKEDGAPGRKLNRIDQVEIERKVAVWTTTPTSAAPARRVAAKPTAGRSRVRRRVL
jgi:hypothetical protein